MAISAFVPFLALSVVAENSRSLRYGMEELELSSRFSLKAIVMARMGVIGLGNLMLLLILAAFVWRRSSLLTAGVYLLLPYLLATFLNLMLVRKVSGKESIYSCLGITILASAASVLPGVMNISIMGANALRLLGWRFLRALPYLRGVKLKNYYNSRRNWYGINH